jgi:hypothetical protein
MFLAMVSSNMIAATFDEKDINTEKGKNRVHI